MLEQIKTAVKSPEFQRKVAHVGGNVVAFIATAVLAEMVHRAVDAGVDALMDKIQSTEEVAAE